MLPTSIFVINLPGQSDRRISISTQLDSTGLGYEIVPAVDGRKLSSEELGAHYRRDSVEAGVRREMTLGEIGCALSHQSVYRRMIEQGLPWAVIVEDDARLGTDFPSLLGAVVDRLDTGLPEIYLFSHIARYTNWGRRRILGKYWLVNPVRAHGGHCYLLTVAAARALLRINYPVHAPIDSWIRFQREGSVTIRAVVPYGVGLAACEKNSTIEPERRARRASDSKRWFWWIEKYLYRKVLYRLLIKYILREHKQELTW